jgi:hypothetical protein
MDIRQPGESTFQDGPRIAEIRAGVRIKEAFKSRVAVCQYNPIRLISVPRLDYG